MELFLFFVINGDTKKHDHVKSQQGKSTVLLKKTQ